MSAYTFYRENEAQGTGFTPASRKNACREGGPSRSSGLSMSSADGPKSGFRETGRDPAPA